MALTPYVVYRLALADLGTSGLGTPVYTNILNTSGYDKGAPLVFGKALNSSGFLEFTIPTDTSGMPELDPLEACGQKEVHLYRSVDGGAESLVWAGRIWSADVGRVYTRFYCEGWISTLKMRANSADYWQSARAHDDIAWDFIDYTQGLTGGALGITRGTDTGSAPTRTLLICAEERQVIMDIIEDLASADTGFDYEITDNKVWNTWTPYKQTDVSGSVVFDTATNVRDLSNYVVDASTVRNEWAGVGQIEECNGVEMYVATDSTSRSKFGLLQATLSRSDLNIDKPFFRSMVDEALKITKEHRWPLQITFNSLMTSLTPFSSFSLGDKVNVQASYGWATFDRNFRVLAWQCTANNQIEDFTVELGEVRA